MVESSSLLWETEETGAQPRVLQAGRLPSGPRNPPGVWSLPPGRWRLWPLVRAENSRVRAEGTKPTFSSMPEYTLRPDFLLGRVVPSLCPSCVLGDLTGLLPLLWPSPADQQGGISLELNM